MGRTRLTQHGTIGTGSTHRGERPRHPSSRHPTRTDRRQPQ
jgi:hypothetical protein